jgi:streptomycin 6-kinase
LFAIPEEDQDVIIAAMLQRLWRTPASNTFRPLSVLIDHWRRETLTAENQWPDPGLVTAGLQLMQELAARADNDFVLVTDLHGGNVLRAEREPWLMIDPKPFIGDAAYDVTQHLLNCESRLQSDTLALIGRMAELCHVDLERVRLWVFARAASEPRMQWNGSWKLQLARRLAP